MNRIIDFFRKMIDFLVGWIEIFFHKSSHYSYVIDDIELQQLEDTVTALIRYRLVGCRVAIADLASSLNKSHLFSLFRPDHAQIIVSLATIEALLNKSSYEINDKYLQYINHCIVKIREKKRP